MKKVVVLTAFVILTSFKGNEGTLVFRKQPCNSTFDGKSYQCSVKPGKPRWDYYFMFYCEGDSLCAIIMGQTSSGYFFRSTVNNLVMSNDSISFNFIEGELFPNQFDLANYRNYTQRAVSFSEDRLYYRGSFKGDSIINLRCQNRYYLCSVDTLLFRKK